MPDYSGILIIKNSSVFGYSGKIRFIKKDTKDINDVLLKLTREEKVALVSGSPLAVIYPRHAERAADDDQQEIS